MDLSYAKLRKVLSVFLKNKVLRTTLNELLKGKQKEIDELGFLDMLEESKADIEILEILTEKKPEDVSAVEAFETYALFFCSIKASWQKFKPLLDGLGLKVEAEIVKT
ncbi:MAG: hypothetical protein K8S23_08160 [Candidatus Cloacimonetes bacterium]|nr:hypothetical protein [Candidatus Cloacimonadota bacterium]